MKTLVLFFLCCILFFSGFAQERASQPKPDPEIQTVKLIAYLTRYAQTNNDALSYLQAARLLDKNPIHLISAAEASTLPLEITDETDHHPFFLSIDTLLARGRLLAGADTSLLALATELTDELSARTRGRLNGPKTMAAQVKGGSSFVATWTFKGGEIATVSVIGDGDNDLDLLVFDKADKLVAKDEGHTDACEVHFTPLRNADYKVVIKNWGNSYSDFVLITN